MKIVLYRITQNKANKHFLIRLNMNKPCSEFKLHLVILASLSRNFIATKTLQIFFFMHCLLLPLPLAGFSLGLASQKRL